MKFRNVTPDDLWVPTLGVSIPAGETTPDLDEDLSAGFLGQVEVWTAVGAEDKKFQKQAVAETPEGEQ